MTNILTLDIGTTSVKAGLFGEGLRPLGAASVEYALLTPGAGLVEMEPEAYWQACKDCVAKLARDANAAPGLKSLRAVAVTSQGETLIPVDEGGKPLRNAIVWLDARAGEEAAYLNDGFHAGEIYRATGMAQIGPACPAAKVLWIRKNEPRAFARTHKFLLLPDYILFRLTGRFVTDRCILSSTGWFDIGAGRYWDRMLARMGMDAEKFPEAVEAGSVAGAICGAAADELGVNRGAPAVPCGMDQAASAVGAGNIEDGIVTETTGTALVLARAVGRPDFGGTAMVNVMRHALPGKFLLLPYEPTAGIVLKWFKDAFCGEEERRSRIEGRPVYELLDDLAAGVPPLSHGLLAFPHFEGMLSPAEDAGARGAFLGVRLGAGKAHFIRAILEGTAYMLRENLELLESLGAGASEIRSLGGGARSALWAQIKADVCGRRVLTMENGESTSLGAAILAATATGLCADCAEACRSAVRTARTFEPDEANHAIYEEGYGRYKEIHGRLKGLFG